MYRTVSSCHGLPSSFRGAACAAHAAGAAAGATCAACTAAGGVVIHLCSCPRVCSAPALATAVVNMVLPPVLLTQSVLLVLLLVPLLQAVQPSSSRHWGQARGMVMLNIQNWNKQRVRSSRMQNMPMKPPTWEDVLLLVGSSVVLSVCLDHAALG